MAITLSTVYLLMLYGLYVPDWKYHIPIEASSSSRVEVFTVGLLTLRIQEILWPEPTCIFLFYTLSIALKVKCGVRADTGPACNAAGMIDRAVLGIQRLYRKPIYARTEVIFPWNLHTRILLSFFFLILGSQCYFSLAAMQHQLTRLWSTSSWCSFMVSSPLRSRRNFKVSLLLCTDRYCW